jgi:hypothetical protein
MLASTFIAAETSATASIVLYSAGFALEVLGGLLIALEIRRDVQETRRVAADVAWERIDALPAFVGECLPKRLWPFAVALLLILLGAAAGLVANILAV